MIEDEANSPRMFEVTVRIAPAGSRDAFNQHARRYSLLAGGRATNTSVPEAECQALGLERLEESVPIETASGLVHWTRYEALVEHEGRLRTVQVVGNRLGVYLMGMTTLGAFCLEVDHEARVLRPRRPSMFQGVAR